MTKSLTDNTPAWKIAIAWLIVLVPFAWGIYYTLQSFTPLLRR
jgi:hypothetical protein